MYRIQGIQERNEILLSISARRGGERSNLLQVHAISAEIPDAIHRQGCFLERVANNYTP